jgi:hypothetical protein
MGVILSLPVHSFMPTDFEYRLIGPPSPQMKYSPVRFL